MFVVGSVELQDCSTLCEWGREFFSCLPSNPVCSRHAQAFRLSPPLFSFFLFSPGEVEKAFCCRHCTKRDTSFFSFSLSLFFF